MKAILIFALAAFAGTASAQDTTFRFKRAPGVYYFDMLKKGQSMTLGEAGERIRQFKRLRDSAQQAPALPIAGETPGVRVLPQDNMPCVVPDTSGIAAIPNAFASPRVPFISRMPNGWKPRPKTGAPVPSR